MRLTRRGLVAGGLALGTAGCLSDGSNVRYPARADEPIVDEERTAAATETPGETVADPHPALGRRTGRIYTELRWFATEYETAIRRFREVAARARAAAERIRTARDVTDAAIDRVEARTDRLLAVTATHVEPHFGVRGFIETQTSRHLDVTRTFARRGDLDRALEEVERLETFLDGLARGQFVGQQLSRNPVRNRLLDALRRYEDGDDPEDDGEGDLDRDAEADDVLFELYDGRSGLRTYAYDGPSRIADQDADVFDGDRGAFDDETLSMQESLFRPAVARRRRGLAYVVARPLPDEERQPDPVRAESYPWSAAMIQRFESVRAARAGERSLLDGPVTAEGRAEVAGRRWRRVFYPGRDDVIYAFMLRAGPHLLVLGPSETAWNERVDWTDGVDRSWLWTG